MRVVELEHHGGLWCFSRGGIAELVTCDAGAFVIADIEETRVGCEEGLAGRGEPCSVVEEPPTAGPRNLVMEKYDEGFDDGDGEGGDMRDLSSSGLHEAVFAVEVDAWRRSGLRGVS